MSVTVFPSCGVSTARQSTTIHTKTKSTVPPHRTALVEPVHSQNGGRCHFVLSWAVPTRRAANISLHYDGARIHIFATLSGTLCLEAYISVTQSSCTGWSLCTSAWAQSLTSETPCVSQTTLGANCIFHWNDLAATGVLLLTMEARRGAYRHQLALSVLRRHAGF
jgi:hypothetical protein